jgi:ubiquinone/menaquinone biosynthesis C-methylase UbiE
MTSEHWNKAYTDKAPDKVSWYRPHLEHSLSVIERSGLDRGAAIVDVGGGASTLVDDLLARGYSNVTVLDIASSALEQAKARLESQAGAARWLVGDITTIELPAGSYAFWHDRAVFHFLREEADRRGYIAALRRSVRVGGHVLIGTFGPEGPERCSGLDVVRYSAEELSAQFGDGFDEVDRMAETHVTPSGRTQQFVYWHGRRVRSGGDHR